MKVCNENYKYASITTLVIMVATSLYSPSDAFVQVHPFNHHLAAPSSEILAKNTNKNKKRLGGPRGAGGRGKLKKDGVGDLEDEDEDKVVKKVPQPKKLRKTMHEFQSSEDTSVRVCAIEVDDVEWMENRDNDNPYGGKLWPSSLAISEFLVSMGTLNGYDILDIGCGVGLVSIVAAESGARVVASDISPLALKLCKIGWLETQKLRSQTNDRKEEDENDIDVESNIAKPGSLNTLALDLFSERPLPMSTSSSNRKVVVATAMFYDKELAAGLARRAFEACTRGAWVMIGDDDTGEREGGRNYFILEMDKLEEESEISFDRQWSQSIVKSKVLQWSEKQVKVLHLNKPEDIEL